MRRMAVLRLRVFSVTYVFVSSLKPSAHALSYLLLRGHYGRVLRYKIYFVLSPACHFDRSEGSERSGEILHSNAPIYVNCGILPHELVD